MLAAGERRAAAGAHLRRADALTAVWREAREAGRKHAIEDFLFTYYPTRMSHLRRWHPGAGVVLADDDGDGDRGIGGAGAPRDDDELAGPADPGPPGAGWRWYTRVPAGVTLDREAFLAERGDAVRYLRELLAATTSRAGTFGCFGLHEWAMVYRDKEAGRDHRHPLPLRLGHAGTDAVVESHPVRCSHFDAYRFFTPEARDRNALRPTRATQPALEQPGCLHANMDLYKWCLKLGPAVPGDLLLDAFELARDIRYTDMAASPYDVSGYGVAAVAIETPEGKAEYVRRQRDFAERAAGIRARLVAVCDLLAV
ncbi:hypothetical protein GCM10009751_38260 [Myceligenerans crystallogenes]|uniref:3-methyladenine DNA glycosylase n=1 Tax=Myceligenerans crystallogenes TaxID=316335 RepID=A0ABN2NLU6_9MICO